jgi:hypothetical protein
MRVKITNKVLGDVAKTTWVGSGSTPDTITSALFDASQTCVQSIAAVSSGGGYYFAMHQLPNTPGWYCNEWKASLGGYFYVSRQLIKVNDVEAGP